MLSECCDARPIPETDLCSKCNEHAVFYDENELDIEAAIALPTGFSAHVFGCCNTHGGSSFRHWCMLFYHRGVFIGFDNHLWVIRVSSNPNVEWRRGCQNSCANGDPYPHSDNAELLYWGQVPDEIKPKVAEIVNEAVGICRERVREEDKKRKAAFDYAESGRQKTRQKIVDNWSD